MRIVKYNTKATLMAGVNNHKFTKSDIEFNVGDRNIKFSIIHNMPKILGLSIEMALDNWLVRTRKYTSKNFVEYINSKHTGYFAMTESDYNNIKQQ